MFLMETKVTGHAFKAQASHYFSLPTLPRTLLTYSRWVCSQTVKLTK